MDYNLWDSLKINFFCDLTKMSAAGILCSAETCSIIIHKMVVIHFAATYIVLLNKNMVFWWIFIGLFCGASLFYLLSDGVASAINIGTGTTGYIFFKDVGTVAL